MQNVLTLAYSADVVFELMCAVARQIETFAWTPDELSLVEGWTQADPIPGRFSALDQAHLLRLIKTCGYPGLSTYMRLHELVRAFHLSVVPPVIPETSAVHPAYVNITISDQGIKTDPAYVVRVLDAETELMLREAVVRFECLTSEVSRPMTLQHLRQVIDTLVPSIAVSPHVQAALALRSDVQRFLVVGDTLMAIQWMASLFMPMTFGDLDPMDPANGFVPQEHVAVFLDLARQGRETEFKDLARMILDRLTPGDIEVMWTGTVRRLRVAAPRATVPVRPTGG